MLVEPNWGNFRAKFNGKEQKTFEWFSSLLFYKEHGQSKGMLRYLNQAGIESDPIVIKKKTIGWQAKFITKLSDHKKDLIESIDKAKEENPKLTDIYFYTNVDFTPSSKSGVKEPAYKIEIEDHAKSKGIKITWKTAAFFETPYVCEENVNIAKYFFSLEKSALDFIQELTRHAEAILEPIRSEIKFNDHTIKIDRSELVEELQQVLLKSPFVIISGEGGAGKTAVIKDFYITKKEVTPLFIFKASEFNISNVNQLLKDYGSFTLSEFIQEFVDIKEKYIVIDSAEKLSDIEHPEIFLEFLSTVRNAGWKIIFTTRLSYLDDLKQAFVQIYGVSFEPLNIPTLKQEELVRISTEYQFSLPESDRLRKLIQNPFYLNEYLRSNPTGNTKITYTDFKETMWNTQIAKSSHRKNNIHRKREECFLEIARKRATSGLFFVTVQNAEESLHQLEFDEIIKFDSNVGGYFITHDIYEEWALEKIIERAFNVSQGQAKFYEEIGSSLPIRRAFRSWLSDKLALNNKDVIKLIEITIDLEGVDRHWKDEVIIAVLLSNHANTFIDQFGAKLLEKPEKVIDQGISSPIIRSFLTYYKYEDKLLYKILFLLRVACKEIDQDLLNILGVSDVAVTQLFTKPKGSGWNSVISFLNKHKGELGLMYMHLILPVLDDWNRYNKNGVTTKDATQIALFYYSELIKDDGHLPYGSSDEMKEQLIRVIFSGSSEVTEELKNIFKEVLTQEDTSRRTRHYELVNAALSGVTTSGLIAQNLPEEIIALAKLFWFFVPEKEDGWYSDNRNDMEQYFDIASNHSDYYPASSFQTPIFPLLQVAPQQAVDFILSFTNRSVEYFAKSEFAQYEAEETSLFMEETGEPIKQYICHRVWNLYRGTQTAPALLESVHMALERWLLIHSKTTSSEIMESWCLYLLRNSRSASITAVVASVVLAQPSKFFNVALILFRTKDFFLFDTARVQLDMGARQMYSISHDPAGLHRNERLRTCDDKHRNMSLEHLALNYQVFRSETEDEEIAKGRQEAIWKILDKHYAGLPKKAKETEADKTWRLYLARMDRRKMKITTENKDGKVHISFNPEIDSELKKYSEDSLSKGEEAMKYTPLQVWARYRFEYNNDESKKYSQYENDVKHVIADTKAILAGLENDTSKDKTFTLFYQSVPAYTCAVLIRDYFDQLSPAEKDFSKDTIMNYALTPLNAGYRYQSNDGANIAINILPILIKAFPEHVGDIKKVLLFALFDSYPVGMSQNFSDYAVSAILQHMWKENSADANSLFFGYLLLKPRLEDIYEELRKQNYKNHVYESVETPARERFSTEHESDILKIITNKITSLEVPLLSDMHSNILVSAFLLLPPGSTDLYHKKFIEEVCDILSKRMSSRHEDEERFDYSLRHKFLAKLAELTLMSNESDIALYVKPFLQVFKDSRESADILTEFITAQDRLNRYDQFWVVWNFFYPKIQELSRDNYSRSHLSNIIHTYLFAWQHWNKEAKEWHTLKERERTFFKKASEDMGAHPAVLYSLAKFLNEIGRNYVDDGINWISNIIQNNASLVNKELEVNTVYYLENLVRGYVLRNRYSVRTSPEIKKQILSILNFLLEKGSATAYLLREDIL